jgi:hypothetical protein
MLLRNQHLLHDPSQSEVWDDLHEALALSEFLGDTMECNYGKADEGSSAVSMHGNKIPFLQTIIAQNKHSVATCRPYLGQVTVSGSMTQGGYF